MQQLEGEVEAGQESGQLKQREGNRVWGASPEVCGPRERSQFPEQPPRQRPLQVGGWPDSREASLASQPVDQLQELPETKVLAASEETI